MFKKILKMHILTTERLKLRRFTLEDAPFVVELLNTPLWLKFIGDRNVKTLEDAVEYLQKGILKNYETLGYGFYLVEEKASNQKIGMCGFVNREELPAPDLGFAFLPDYISRGFGSEIAAATLNFGKNDLQLEKISAIVNPENQASNALLKKLGFIFQNKIWFGEKKELLNYYEI